MLTESVVSSEAQRGRAARRSEPMLTTVSAISTQSSSASCRGSPPAPTPFSPTISLLLSFSLERARERSFPWQCFHKASPPLFRERERKKRDHSVHFFQSTQLRGGARVVGGVRGSLVVAELRPQRAARASAGTISVFVSRLVPRSFQVSDLDVVECPEITRTERLVETRDRPHPRKSLTRSLKCNASIPPTLATPDASRSETRSSSRLVTTAWVSSRLESDSNILPSLTYARKGARRDFPNGRERVSSRKREALTCAVKTKTP